MNKRTEWTPGSPDGHHLRPAAPNRPGRKSQGPNPHVLGHVHWRRGVKIAEEILRQTRGTETEGTCLCLR